MRFIRVHGFAAVSAGWSGGVSNPGRRTCKASLDTCPRPDVPTEGVEPSRPEGHRVLNAARLPFRQVGVLLVLSVGVEPTRHEGAAT